MNLRAAPHITFVMSVLAGCANSELTIHVDLYNEDPRFFPPAEPAVAQALIRDMQQLRTAAEQTYNLRMQLGDESLNLFSFGWLAAGGRQDLLSDMQNNWSAEKEALQKRRNVFDKSVATAIAAAEAYIASYSKELTVATKTIKGRQAAPVSASTEKDGTQWPRPDRPPNRDAVLRELPATLRGDEGKMRAAVEKAAADYVTLRNLPAVLRVDWQLLENMLNFKYQSVASDVERQALRQVSNGLRRDIQLLVARTQATVATPDVASRFAAAPTLSRSAAQVGQELETLRDSLPQNASARTALSNLVVGSSKFFEVIDRLQDAGDPVWRTITDPANEPNWNRQFTRTYFYAEGDAAVVVVRDNPMRFRVHHGENNPTALIQGQLEISRAITDAALSIAGAAAGFPTEGLASQGAAVDTSGVGAESEDLAKRRVTAEVATERRAALLRSLQSSLRVTSVELARTESGDADAIARQRDAMIATLTSIKRLLETPGDD